MHISPPMPKREASIAGVRLRRGFLGKVVMQVSYNLESLGPRAPGKPSEWVPCGRSAWSDANANNIGEMLMIANHLGLAGQDA